MSFFERAPVENSKSYILRYFSTERNILNILIPRVFPQGFNIISTEFSTDLGQKRGEKSRFSTLSTVKYVENCVLQIVKLIF